MDSGSPGSWKRNVCTARESSGLPFCFSHTGVSTMNWLRHNCTTDATEENNNTNLHRVGVAIRKPSNWVIMIPNTIASCVRTPDPGNEVSYVNENYKSYRHYPLCSTGRFQQEKQVLYTDRYRRHSPSETYMLVSEGWLRQDEIIAFRAVERK